MLTDLRKITEVKLGIKVTHAVAIVPHAPKVPEPDLKDAFEHAGIKLLLGRKGFFEKKGNSPYGGVSTRHGLCESWADRKKCKAEEQAMTGEQTLSITYTNNSLQVDSLLVYNAQHVVRGYSNSFRHLGSRAVELETGNSSMDLGEIMERLHQGRIMQIKSAGWGLGKKKFQRMVLMGESAEDKDFLKAVWIALADLESLGFLAGRSGDMYSAIQTPEFNALYTGARGAAELAIRWQEKRYVCYDAAPEVHKPMQTVTPAPEKAPVACTVVQVATGSPSSKKVIMEESINNLNLDVKLIMRALWRMSPMDVQATWSMEVQDCPGRPRKLYGIVDGSRQWSQTIYDSEFESEISWTDGTTSEEIAYSRIENYMPRTTMRNTDYLMRILNLNPDWVRSCVEKYDSNRYYQNWSIQAIKAPGRGRELWIVMGESVTRVPQPTNVISQVEMVAWGNIKPDSGRVLVTIYPGSQEFGEDLTAKILKSNFDQRHRTREQLWEVWARKGDHSTLAPLWVFFDGKYQFRRIRP